LVLKKKSNAAVHYHAVRETVAMGECATGHVSTHDANPADICMKKLIPGGQKRDHHGGADLIMTLLSYTVTRIGFKEEIECCCLLSCCA
jgi:hypothetical protein